MRFQIFMIIFLVMGNAFGTTFVPVTIQKQIKSSTGMVEGVVVATNSEQIENGQIVSRVFIKANKWMGVSPENNHVEIYYPGGTLGSVSQSVHGSPEFKAGEKVVVFTKETSGKTWVQNLALGKFQVKSFGNNKVMMSSVFPMRPDVGQMPMSSFYQIAQRIKGEKFKERFKDKYELELEVKANSYASKGKRTIASVQEFKKQSNQKDKINAFWLLMALGALGGLVVFTRRSKLNK